MNYPGFRLRSRRSQVRILSGAPLILLALNDLQRHTQRRYSPNRNSGTQGVRRSFSQPRKTTPPARHSACDGAREARRPLSDEGRVAHEAPSLRPRLCPRLGPGLMPAPRTWPRPAVEAHPTPRGRRAGDHAPDPPSIPIAPPVALPGHRSGMLEGVVTVTACPKEEAEVMTTEPAHVAGRQPGAQLIPLEPALRALDEVQAGH